MKIELHKIKVREVADGFKDSAEEDEPVRILTDVLDVMRAVQNGCVNVICPIAPVNELSLAALIPILKHKKLTIEF